MTTPKATGELVVRELESGRTVMTLDAALAWLHSHGYAEDVELTREYLVNGGTIRTMASTWALISESEARALDGDR